MIGNRRANPQHDRRAEILDSGYRPGDGKPHIHGRGSPFALDTKWRLLMMYTKEEIDKFRGTWIEWMRGDERRKNCGSLETG